MQLLPDEFQENAGAFGKHQLGGRIHRWFWPELLSMFYAEHSVLRVSLRKPTPQIFWLSTLLREINSGSAAAGPGRVRILL